MVKFAGPNLLQQYISYGIGDCRSVPILCMQPEEKIFTPQIDNTYADTLVPHAFPKMSIDAPKGFTLVNELIKKEYYKKRRPGNKSVIYLLIQEPGAFIKLYPQVRKQAVMDNHEFIRRLMYAQLNRVKNITDAFFVIMKSIFIPDIGSPGSAKMIKFQTGEFSGFINYSMTKKNNYFDCNVLGSDDNFFKVYIKDDTALLDLNKVFTIISTLKPVN